MSSQIQITGETKVKSLTGVLVGTTGVVSSLAFDVAGGVPKLDVNGKILVAQLPNSVMEYMGTWNAATNTPTLTNGGAFNQGDVFLCTTAGTVDFGAGGPGPIAFVVGDQVIYSGSIWQRASGATGTVTSVAVTESGDSLNITGSPITTSGTINIGFNGTNLQYVNGAGNLTTFPTLITSIGLSMPSAFSVANSPLTANGTIAVTGAGVASQYIRGDGTLADFPSSGGGGSSVSYYLNGGTSQGTIGGVTYYEMSKTAVIGTGVDFAKSGDGFIVAFLTDANDPAQLNIPAGNWNYEIYASMSSNGGTPQMYAELYKYDGTTFTLISTSSNEILYDGTALNLYTFAMAVPDTSLTLTDRLAVKLYATNSGGKTTTIHTQDGHLCQIITTFSTGITALNGLTAQVQYFQTGTSGTDFNISSTTATHTFNIPDASATARGLITTGTQTIAGTKTFNDATKNNGGIFLQNASSSSLAGYMNLGGLTNGLKFTSGGGISNTFTLPSATGYTFTFPNATGTIALTSDLTGGTVTSVAALTIGTTGTDLSSSVANSTTTPVITLNVPTASATNRGALSSADWSTFNNKQSALTNPVTGTGTTNYLPKFTGASTIGNSVVQEASGFIGIGVSPSRKLHVLGGAATSQIQSTGTSSIMYFGDASSTVIDNQGFGSIGNSLYLLAGGVERLYLTSTGNLGLGVTPSAWSGYTVFQNAGGSLIGATGELQLWQNAYYNGTSSIYINSSTATRYNMVAGQHRWYNAPSGTAGNAITFTQAMTLGSNSGLSIGTTTAAAANGLLVAGAATFSSSVAIGTGATIANDITWTNDTGYGLKAQDGTRYLSYTTAGGTILGSTGSAKTIIQGNGGNVGIATTTPRSTLDVNGTTGLTWSSATLESSGLVTIGTRGIGGSLFINTPSINTDWSAGLGIDGSFSSNVSTVNIKAFGPKLASGGLQGSNLTFSTTLEVTLSERMRIDRFGNVGIGTTSPSQKLSVVGTTDIISYSNGTTRGYLYSDANGVGLFNGAIASGTGLYLRTSNILDFYINSSIAARFTSGGNLLVGTTTDSGYKLDVNGTGRFSQTTAIPLTVQRTSVNSNVGIRYQNSTTSWYAGLAGDDSFGISFNDANLASGQLKIASTGVATFSSDVILSAANPFVYGGTSVGGVGISNISGSSYIKIYAASHATLPNNIQFVNASSTSFLISNTGAVTFSANVQIGSATTASGLSQLTVGNLLGYAALKLSIDATKYSWIAGAQYNVDNGFEITPSTAVGGSTFTTPVFKITQAGVSTFTGIINANGGVAMGGQILAFDQSGTRSWSVQATGGNLSFQSGDNGGAFSFLSALSGTSASFSSTVTATGFFESSDSRLKTLIQDNYQTKSIASITPKLYTKNGKVELGYYAQDFVGVLDSAVSKGSDDMLSLSYREVLVAKVYALEQRIKELENK
jgi:hypothetical protein